MGGSTSKHEPPQNIPTSNQPRAVVNEYPRHPSTSVQNGYIFYPTSQPLHTSPPYSNAIPRQPIVPRYQPPLTYPGTARSSDLSLDDIKCMSDCLTFFNLQRYDEQFKRLKIDLDVFLIMNEYDIKTQLVTYSPEDRQQLINAKEIYAKYRERINSSKNCPIPLGGSSSKQQTPQNIRTSNQPRAVINEYPQPPPTSLGGSSSKQETSQNIRTSNQPRALINEYPQHPSTSLVAPSCPITGTETTIYVRDFDAAYTPQKIQNEFNKFGPITNCQVIHPRDAKAKVFAFITFSSNENAVQAIAEMNGQKMGTGKVFVAFKNANKKTLEEFMSKKHLCCDQTMKKRIHGNDGVSHNPAAHVYVRGLKKQSFTTRDLEKLFEIFGTITSSRIIHDNTGRSRGFGFVNFQEKANAVKAIATLNGLKNCAQFLYVSFDHPEKKDDVQTSQKIIVESCSSSATQSKAEPMKSSDRSMSQAGDCSICMDEPINTVILPCGHACVCETCAVDIQAANNRCPICRANIEKITKMFLCT